MNSTCNRVPPILMLALVPGIGACSDGLKLDPDGIEYDFCLQDVEPECQATGVDASKTDAFDSEFRAVHIGTEARQAPLVERLQRDAAALSDADYSDYFDFLAATNVNYVGITVALRFDGTPSAATVSLDRAPILFDDRTPNLTYTYPAAVLSSMVAAFKSRGMKVMLNFALEPGDASGSAVRQELGVPIASWPSYAGPSPNSDSYFWDPGYTGSDREAKLDAFWDSYLSSMVDVIDDFCDPVSDPAGCPDLVSLGTETNGLFRSDADWVDNLQAMVSTLRDGSVLPAGTPLTFGAMDSLYGESRFTGTRTIWKTLELDYIGVDTYQGPSSTFGDLGDQCDYEEGFSNRMFDAGDGLKSLINDNITATNNGNTTTVRRVLFLEAGWPDVIGVAWGTALNEGAGFLTFDDLGELPVDEFVDAPFDGWTNSIGRQEQAEVLAGFFSVREGCDDMVLGTFLWNNSIMTTQAWNEHKADHNQGDYSIRPWDVAPDDPDDTARYDSAQSVVAFFYSSSVWEKESAETSTAEIPEVERQAGTAPASDSGSPDSGSPDSGSPDSGSPDSGR